MDVQRLVVVGISGLVSGRLYEQRSRLGVESVFLSRSSHNERLRLDLAHPEEYQYNSLSPDDVIVFLAAVSSPDECENNPACSVSINLAGTVYFIREALLRGSRVLFASSDIVYGDTGDSVAYEDAQCKPVGMYGQMKLAVEESFLGEDLFKSMRLSLVYAHNDRFTKYLVSSVVRNSPAEIYDPICRNVVYIQDVLDGIISIAGKWTAFPTKIVNMTGPDLLSRKDLADIHRVHILRDLTYYVSYPGDDFFRVRPKTIHARSRHFPDILGRPQTRIEDAVHVEFAQGYHTGRKY